MEQRIPKFRAWDEKNKQMGVVMNMEFNAKIIEPNLLNPSDKDLERISRPSVIEYTFIATCLGKKGEFQIKDIKYLMDFTGLLDRNRKEIYIGDIVKIDRDYETGKLVPESNEKVYWKDGEFIIHRTRYPKDWEHYEVIGNVYENPKLLNKETKK